MIESHQNSPNPAERSLAKEIGGKAARKLKARRRKDSGIWSGLGMMGLIGWSVAVPTLLGAVLGIWLDTHHPSTHSLTLSLLIIGLLLGCVNAWRWVANEDKSMKDEQEDDHE
jgi:ATP synthase protein I